MKAAKNPFAVLHVEPTASPRELERQGQRLLAELALERDPGAPPTEREFEVRWALDELRDARRRLVHEALAPALGPGTIAMAELTALCDELVAALPRASGDDLEARLWAALPEEPPYVLPPEHAAAREAAFQPLVPPPRSRLLAGEVEWSALLGISE